MADLVSDVMGFACRYFPDAKPSEVLRAINLVHRELQEGSSERIDRVTISTLVAGTGEYALDDGVLRVWGATYYSSASDYKRLNPTSVPELDIAQFVWEEIDPAEPHSFYLANSQSGGMLGLFPKPDISSSGGYPKVVLRASVVTNLSSGDTLPGWLLSSKVYEFGALRFLAAELEPARVAEFQPEYEMYKAKEKNHELRRNAGMPTYMVPEDSYPGVV